MAHTCNRCSQIVTFFIKLKDMCLLLVLPCLRVLMRPARQEDWRVWRRQQRVRP